MYEEVLRLTRDGMYNRWKTARQERLEKLYDIREVFEARLKDAEEDLTYHVEQREEAVAEKLIDAGIDQSDLNAYSEIMLQKRKKKIASNDKDSYNSHKEMHLNESDDDHESTSVFADDEDDDSLSQGHNKSEIPPCISIGDDANSSNNYGDFKESNTIDDIYKLDVNASEEFILKRRAARTNRKEIRKKYVSIEASSLRLEEERLKAIHYQALKIKESSIQTEERIAEANVRSLTLQLEKVDELLETLQEEV